MNDLLSISADNASQHGSPIFFYLKGFGKLCNGFKHPNGHCIVLNTEISLVSRLTLPCLSVVPLALLRQYLHDNLRQLGYGRIYGLRARLQL